MLHNVNNARPNKEISMQAHKISSSHLVPGCRIKSQAYLIGPDLAREWMKLNSSNRPLRPGHLEYIKGIMERGEWKLTHQGIGFAPNGRLVDGQHRLLAIIATGLTLPVLVSYDVPEDAFSAMDTGAVRSHTDVLGTPRKVTECATFIRSRLMCAGSKGGRSSPAQVLSVINVAGAAIDELYRECGSRSGKVFGTAAAYAVASIRILARPREKEHITYVMRTLVTRDYTQMLPVAASLCRQVDEIGTGAGSASNLPSRLWVAIDPAKQNISKVQIKSPEDIMAQIRAEAIKLFGE